MSRLIIDQNYLSSAADLFDGSSEDMHVTKRVVCCCSNCSTTVPTDPTDLDRLICPAKHLSAAHFTPRKPH
jgi:hypothetical protein